MFSITNVRNKLTHRVSVIHTAVHDVEGNCTLVLVSHLTSSCWTRRERTPAMLTPQHHGTQWQPGPITVLNFPNFSFTAMVDWSTWYKPHTCPISPDLSVGTAHSAKSAQQQSISQHLMYGAKPQIGRRHNDQRSSQP
jgi:hypothetical protein